MLYVVAMLAQTASVSGSAVPVQTPKPKKICRSFDSTGSIMGTRICHTADEWAAIENEKRQARDRNLGLGRDLNALGKPN